MSKRFGLCSVFVCAMFCSASMAALQPSIRAGSLSLNSGIKSNPGNTVSSATTPVSTNRAASIKSYKTAVPVATSNNNGGSAVSNAALEALRQDIERLKNEQITSSDVETSIQDALQNSNLTTENRDIKDALAEIKSTTQSSNSTLQSTVQQLSEQLSESIEDIDTNVDNRLKVHGILENNGVPFARKADIEATYAKKADALTNASLDSYATTDSVSNAIAAAKNEVNSATDTKINAAKTEIATQSETSIQTAVDTALTGYATQDYVDTKVQNVSIPETTLSDYVKKETILDNGTLKEDILPSKVVTSLDGYATQDYVDTKVQNVSIPETTLSDYVKKETILENGTLKENVLPSKVVTSLDGYATQNYVNEQIQAISISGGGSYSIKGSVDVYSDLSNTSTYPKEAGTGYIVKADGMLYVCNAVSENSSECNYPSEGNGISVRGQSGNSFNFTGECGWTNVPNSCNASEEGNACVHTDNKLYICGCSNTTCSYIGTEFKQKSVEQQYCEDNIDVVKALYSQIKNTADCTTKFTNAHYSAILGGARAYCLSLITTMDNNFSLSEGIGLKLARTFSAEKMNTLKNKSDLSDRMSLTGFRASATKTDTTFMEACEARYNEIMAGTDGESAWHAYCAADNEANLTNIIKPLYGNEKTCDNFSESDYNAIMGGSTAYCIYILQNKNTIDVAATNARFRKAFGVETFNISNVTKDTSFTISTSTGTKNLTFLNACREKYDQIVNGADGESAWHAYCAADNEANLTNIIKPLYGDEKTCDNFSESDYNAIMGGSTAYCIYILQNKNTIDVDATNARFKKAFGLETFNISNVTKDTSFTISTSTGTKNLTFLNACREKYDQIVNGADGEPGADGDDAAAVWCKAHTISAAANLNGSARLTPSKMLRLYEKNTSSTFASKITISNNQGYFIDYETCLAAVRANPDIMGPDGESDRDFNSKNSISSLNSDTLQTFTAYRDGGFKNSLKPTDAELNSLISANSTIANLTTRMNALDNTETGAIADLNERMAALDDTETGAIAGLTTRMAALDDTTNTNSLASRMNALDSSNTTLTSRMNALDNAETGAIAGLTTRMNALDNAETGAIASLTTRMAALDDTTNTNSLASRMNALDSSNTTLTSRMNALDNAETGAIASLTTRVAALDDTTNTNSLASRMNALDSSNTTLTSRINALDNAETGAIASLTTRMAALDDTTNTNSLASKVNTLTGSAETTGSVANLNARLSALDNAENTDSLVSRMNSLNSSVSTLTAGVGTAGSIAQQVQAATSTLATKNDNNVTLKLSDLTSLINGGGFVTGADGKVRLDPDSAATTAFMAKLNTAQQIDNTIVTTGLTTNSNVAVVVATQAPTTLPENPEECNNTAGAFYNTEIGKCQTCDIYGLEFNPEAEGENSTAPRCLCKDSAKPNFSNGQCLENASSEACEGETYMNTKENRCMACQGEAAFNAASRTCKCSNGNPFDDYEGNCERDFCPEQSHFDEELGICKCDDGVFSASQWKCVK